MPQFLLWVAAGGAAWAAYRWLRKEMGRVRSDLDEAEDVLRKREERSIPTLRRDPETGVYRPDEG